MRLAAETCGRIAIVAPTAADARDVMVEGESGLLSRYPNDSNRPVYEPSRRRVTFANGAIATTYSADEPDRLRGPQHAAAWCDELAAWRYADEAWSNLQMGLRLGDRPRALVTTTPKPLAIIRGLAADPATIITKGATFDNAANLAKQTLDYLKARYDGTRLGRQELYAELLDDAPGALWKRETIDADRVIKTPDLQRVVVSVDPSITAGGDECGIVAVGLGDDGNGYLLADETLQASPDGWARAAIALYHKLGANCIVAEANQGGDMVRLTLQTVDSDVPVTLVHASRSKQARAEPVAALAEQHRLRHVGAFPSLEDELCQWVPGHGLASPNRLDALVWGITELMLSTEAKGDNPRMRAL